MKKWMTLFLLALACLLCAAAWASADSLEYTLLEDGSGYEITGCSPSAGTVTIPAAHKGLPVTAIAGNAFISCGELKEFRTETDQPVFYAEDGVLFTDRPVKTLVRFPNAYPRTFYQAPADLKAVGPWAFAGLKALRYLHFQDGLESFGDHMLDSVACDLSVFVPDSLETIGEGILQNQQFSVAFYGSEYSAFCRFARSGNIPFGIILEWEQRAQTAELAEPDLADAEGLPEPKKKVKVTDFSYWDYTYDLSVICNLSARQGSADTELVVDMSRTWGKITPDAQGRTAEGMDPRTGLYGIGFTGTETVLRGYDREGNLTGTRVVNGDFVFSLPGAYSVGVAGGKDTVLTLLPYQPVIVASTGTLPLDPDHFHYLAEDNRVQYYVIPFPYASVSYDYPFYLNTFSSSFADAAGKNAEDSPHYAIKQISFDDPYLVDRANLIAFKIDHLDVLYETEDFACLAATRFSLDKGYGEKAYKILENVKTVMSGTYYPAGRDVNRVTVRITGEYPISADSVIILDDYGAEYNNDTVVTLAHEMTHAVDQTVGFGMPSAWMEGRAEYVSRKVCKAMGVPCWSYDPKYDWSFLSDEDKADFFRYYTESVNRETEYSVGYYFIQYLCDTYGEDITAKIMENLFAAAAKVGRYEWKIPDEVFRKCITDATAPDVFQDFVRDVVEK